MGSTQSKIETEEVVSRCKDREQLMKEAVSSGNAFTAAHSDYAICLKNTGAAFSDFTRGEFPPPPLPSLQNPMPLQRSASMPKMKWKMELKSVGPATNELEFEAQASEKLTRERSGSSNRGSSTSRENQVEQSPQQPPPPQLQQP